MATKEKAEKPEMLGTGEVAKMLKIDGKKLRVILRKNNVEKEEGRYAWKKDSKFLSTTLPKMIADYDAAAEKEAKEKPAAAKKSAKKTASKKSKKEEPAEEEVEEL